MERLVFVCPTTGKRADLGIETELRTLLRIRGSRVHGRCPCCGKSHDWTVADAELDRAA
jgi:hypothetical protein